MARIRTIKPEFPQSETVGRLSRDARLLYVQLWTIVDDSGRTRAASRLLASLLYPYDDDSPALIEGWLSELERERCIRRYKVDGTIYLEVTSWAEHQKIDRPTASKLPPPPECDAIVTELASPREPSRALDAGPSILDLGLTDTTLSGGSAGERMPAAAPPAKPKRAKPASTATGDPNANDVVTAFEALMGYPMRPTWGREAKAAKVMLASGYTVAQIVACAKAMHADPFWQGKPLHLDHVAAQIGARTVAASDANGHDARFWVSDGAGGYTLRHPALVDLPAPFNANDLTTWPPDMATVYADRLHDDGQGGRFFA